ncbi:hypothetical protein [Bradyrhizobium sp. URHC0002]
MATTESTAPKSHEADPIKALFDLASYWATIWGFVGLCLWLEQRALTNLDVPSGSVKMIILLVSTPAIFLLVVHRFKKDPRVRMFVERIRYVVILAVAGLLGAYLHANHKDQSHDSYLRDGAVLACAKIAACKESAAQYANTR